MAFLKFQASSPARMFVGSSEVSGVYYGSAQVWPLNPPLTLQPGVYVLTGSDIGMRVNRRMTIETGVYMLTGQDVGLTRTRRLTFETGVYALTGSDIDMTAGTEFVFETGVFTLTGQDIGLKYNRVLTIETGVYTLTGQDVTLDYSGGNPAITLTAGDLSGAAYGYGTEAFFGVAVGTISSEPLDGETLLALIYIVAPEFGGPATIAVWQGDVTAKLSGESLSIDGTPYALTDITYDSGNETTSANVDTTPELVNAVAYSIRIV